MEINYEYLLEYRQFLLTEIDVVNQVLTLREIDTVGFPDEVLEIVLDHVRLSISGGYGSGDVRKSILNRVSLFELCRIYYVEKMPNYLICRQLKICQNTFYELFNHYRLPRRFEMDEYHDDSLISFNESLDKDFEKIDIKSQKKYQSDWREGMPNTGDMGITAIRYCHKKRVNHYVAMTQGEEIDQDSGISHLVIQMWWIRAEAHFIEEMSRQALNPLKNGNKIAPVTER